MPCRFGDRRFHAESSTITGIPEPSPSVSAMEPGIHFDLSVTCRSNRIAAFAGMASKAKALDSGFCAARSPGMTVIWDHTPPRPM